MKRLLAILLGVAILASAAQAQMNPVATLTRPNNTGSYSQNTLVASSGTAGSVVVPFFAIPDQYGSAIIARVRLSTNKTTGWDGVTLRVRLWTAAPTYTNGDGGAYAVVTGAATWLGQFDVTVAQFGDGAAGAGTPSVGTAVWLKMPSGTTAVYWDIQYTGTTALTPAANQTFTLTAELAN